jgi:hypothetical protein
VRRSADRCEGRSKARGEKVCYCSGWHGISLDRRQWHFVGGPTRCGSPTSRITSPDVDACVLLFPPRAMLSPVLQSVALFFNYWCIEDLQATLSFLICLGAHVLSLSLSLCTSSVCCCYYVNSLAHLRATAHSPKVSEGLLQQPCTVPAQLSVCFRLQLPRDERETLFR